MNFRKSMIVTLLVLSSLFLSVGPAFSQDSDPNKVVKKAIDYLSKQLPKPFPGVDAFTFTPDTFNDGSLGCPVPGRSYVQVQTPGYRFLLTVKGVIYEVRTNLDGSIVAMCDQSNIKQTANLNLYRSPQFSIPYPDSWTITARDNADFYFGLGALPVCSQPGLIVTPLGALPAGKTADSLLDDYLVGSKSQAPAADRANVGTLGRSLIIQGPCTDGTARRALLVTYVAFGQGYRALLFAPQAAFNQWLDIFNRMAAGFSPSMVSAGKSVRPPDGAPDTLLVHVFGGNVYMASVGDLPGAPLTRDANLISASRRYGLPRVSPDGKNVAFIDVVGRALYLAPIQKNATARLLPVNLGDTPFPVAWSPDGQSLAFFSGKGKFALAIFKMADNSVSERVSLDLAECPSTTNADPAAALLSQEAGVNGDDPLLEWSQPDHLFISQTCDGAGLIDFNPNMLQTNIVPQASSLTRIRLSPTKTQFAGIAGGKLAVFDPAKGELKNLAIDADRVAWSADAKSLFYATRTLKTPLKLDAAAGSIQPFESAAYDLTVHRYDLASGADMLLFQGDGYAIGSLAASPDGSGLLFTLIQSDAALIEGIGRKVSAGDLERLAPTSQLYWLPLSAPGSPILLINTLQPIFGPVGSVPFVGVPVANGARPTPKPAGK